MLGEIDIVVGGDDGRARMLSLRSPIKPLTGMSTRAGARRSGRGERDERPFDAPHTRTISLPRFLPANIPASADGIFSKPSTTSTGAFSFPSASQRLSASSAWARRL